MTARIAALLAGQSFDCAVILSEVGRRYLSGFAASDGFLVCSKGRSVLLVDGRYFEAAEGADLQCEVMLLTDLKAQLPPLLDEMGARSIALERCITVAEAARLSNILSRFDVQPDEQLECRLLELRAVKCSAEVQCITAAQRIAEAAFEQVLGFIKPGVTELELAAELEYQMRRRGAEGMSFDTIAISGANTSQPHGVPTHKPICEGDFVTMDFGAVYGGYHSDMTRTVAVGKITDEQRAVYNTVLSAGEAALAAIKAGVACSQVDGTARGVISDAGYGQYFTHSTGHGVGLQIHEQPNLSPRSVTLLQAGNVVTVEPGIYLPGRYGVRIEDMALVTEGGYINLTTAEKSLISVG